MALSGSFYTTVATHYRLQLEWSATQDVANNQSTITAKLYWMSLDSGWTVSSGATKTGFTKVDGTQENFSGAGLASLNSNQKKLIHTQTKTVTHDSDGTKSVSFDGAFDCEVTLNGTYYSTVSLTAKTYSLDTIPRASSLTSSPDWTTGEALPINISRASSAFTHDITIEVWDGTVYNIVKTYTGIGTGVTWTPTLAENTTLFDYVNNDTSDYSQQTRITVDTYSGSTFIGSKVYAGHITSPTGSTASTTMNYNIGSNVPVTLVKANSAFTHTLRFYVNNVLIHTENNVDAAFTWISTGAEDTASYNAAPSTNVPPSKLEIDTFYNGQKVNATTVKTGVATVANANPIFTTASYADTNGTITAITGNSAYIVQNKSTLQAKVLNANKAAAQKGATSITKYIATFNNVPITVNSPFATDIVFDFGVQNVSVNQTLSIKAYDNRGNFTEVLLTVNIVPWSPPIILSTATRGSGFLDATTITLGGSISPVNVASADKNSLVTASTTWQTRVVGGSYGAATAFTGQTLTMPNYSAANAVPSLANTSSWEVLITVTDKFGSATLTLTVATGKPILFIDSVKKAIGFNDFPANANEFLLNGSLRFGSTQFASAGGALDINNGDIVKANAIWFNDQSDTASEGLNFLKTGAAAGSVAAADHDNFKILDGLPTINGLALPVLDVNGKLILNNGFLVDDGYFEVGTYNQVTYGSGKMQSYYDGVLNTWKLSGRDGINNVVPIDVSISGHTVFNEGGNLQVASGSVTISAVLSSDNLTSISYGKTFPGTPMTVLTPHSNTPVDITTWSTSGATATGCDIRVRVSKAESVAMRWIAIWRG